MLGMMRNERFANKCLLLVWSFLLFLSLDLLFLLFALLVIHPFVR